jgi:hypothetical protein
MTLRSAICLVSIGVAVLASSCRKQVRAPAPPVAQAEVFPGKPVVRLCRKDWSQAQCCAFLCAGLERICGDSPRARPGIESCPAWCPKLTDKEVRCHVFHCYVSISPTGGIKDHDSHCRHAANQLPGGSCPPLVYSSVP